MYIILCIFLIERLIKKIEIHLYDCIEYHINIRGLSLCATLKDVCMTWCYLHILAEAIQVLGMEFSPTGPKILGLFIICFSLFIPQCLYLKDLKKRRG